MTYFSRTCGLLCFLFFSGSVFSLDISKNMPVNFVTEANYYPFEYLDELKQIQGFDIDIANAVCLKANLSCKFYNQSFDSLLLTLQFGRFDAVIAALDITESRKEKVDFSNSYYRFPPVFVSTTNSKEAFSIVGKFIGVQSDSSNHHYLIKHAKKNSFIISYLSSTKAFSDLRNGKIDVVFADHAVVDDFLSKRQNNDKFSVMQTEDVFLDKFSAGYGIAVKKGNMALLERINYGLAKIKEDGTYQTIYDRYFESNK
ncbi:amino acid ABC transporter substrate-binding protein [Psychromonas sp. psych-6C06]|uniref:transporter substrate-binding domain-containing protein n=1 Tax=Psychromonas sp. psych-6C06 TaxID=2058089 RepID=UPI000C33CCCF|nr:transporter substrate-binding domain-containing protein [Psychromonas sp. psych-6C06]PKF61906.1 amino acid ABC transporter substrate-binding protein [Psychromonas sp. psych-6C06]